VPGRQLSLLSRGPLFDPRVHGQYVTERRSVGVPHEEARAKALAEWLQALSVIGRAKETTVEQLFNQKILCEVLGYELYPGAHGSAWPKAPSAATGIAGEPDVLLGFFSPGESPDFITVIELKRPGTPLDEPQHRARAITPIQQAFEYGERILGVRWVLVSDMRVIRLYSVDSPHEYESFDLTQCLRGERPTPQFRELYWFLSREQLIEGGGDSPVSLLLAKSASRQMEVRDSFYEAYYQIRRDLLAEVEQQSQKLDPAPSRQEVLQATQRLLDRMLFLYYCEDNPERLIPRETIKSMTEAARRLPGASTSKVYETLKALFREVDAGSPPEAAVKLNGYNGELFKPDPIIDTIELPDALHDKPYRYRVGEDIRYVNGVWGLHVFDFWTELNEHLLGHIFEQSLSDMQALSHGETPSPDRMRERRAHGIYYTSEILSEYLASNALGALLAEEAQAQRAAADLTSALEARQQRLGELRVIDMACGSGAFLVSSYQALLEEFFSIRDGLEAMRTPASGQRDIFALGQTLTQARLLGNALHGSDLLPQAAEIAKLALWLRSARKDERVADLSRNIVATNSLDVPSLLSALQAEIASFDLVVGNPPWGGDMGSDIYEACCCHLGIEPEPEWDSWELFLQLGLALLRDGGRLAFVLPDTVFSPEKERSRRALLNAGRIEYLHNIGDGWFENVRMGCVLVQVRRGAPPLNEHLFKALVLTGNRRRAAIAGRLPLSQLVARFGRDIPQERCMASPTAEIEVFRSGTDDALMTKMEEMSLPLTSLTRHGRGEEMSRAGLLWVCPSCLTVTVPAKKKKRDSNNPDGSRHETKMCSGCGLVLDENKVGLTQLVCKKGTAQTGEQVVDYYDGDDITRRYHTPPASRQLKLNFDGFDFKPAANYAGPKLLIRQAGVGLMLMLDASDARVPQSVYWYRLTDEAQHEGYSLEYLLAVLLSRTMIYYVFKRFSEIDPSRAHAKVTHQRLKTLPVPKVDFSNTEQCGRHDEIVRLARKLLAGESAVGGSDDMRIDVLLRELWGLSPDDGMHIMLELAEAPDGQVIRELFPNGIPKQILRTTDNGGVDGSAPAIAVPVL
jgi:Eco57I restriction-modification methylase